MPIREYNTVQYHHPLNLTVAALSFDDKSIFHHACIHGNTKIAEIFLQNSAVLNIDFGGKDEFEQTALHYVCMHGHSQIADMLIQKHTEQNIKLNVKGRILRFKRRHLVLVTPLGKQS